MRLLFLLLLLPQLLYSCGGSQEESTEITEEDTTAVESRYTYSGSFEMADQSYLELVRNWNNSIVEGNVEQAISYLADSVDIALADGSYYDATRDSIKTLVIQFLDQITNVNVDFLAGLTVKSTDQGDTWVFSYTDESYMTEEGEVRAIIHESYRILDGKIRSIYQYEQAPAESDVPGENEDGLYRYSGSFEMGNEDHLGIIEGYMDALSENDWDEISQYLADTVSAIFADGSTASIPGDTLASMVRRNVESASDFEFELSAAIPVRSTVQGHDWILIWGEEIMTRPDTVEHYIFHEAILIENNKMAFLRQFLKEPSE